MESDVTCSECGSALHDADKFCSACGHEVPIVALSEEPTDVESGTDDDETVVSRRFARPGVVVGLGILGLSLAAVAIWGLTRSSDAEQQYEASGPLLISSLEDMAGAQSSRVVRELAEGLGAELETIEVTLDADPEAAGSDRLQVMRTAFGALAALQDYTVNNTDAWKDNRQPLLSSLDTMTTYGGVTETAASEGEDAARTLDDLTVTIDKAMAKYRKQSAQARAQARRERQAVQAYRAEMGALIDRYTSLRNATGDYTERMRNERMYMYEIIDYFSQAATDRREIADAMSRLRPPADVRAAHSRVVNAIGDGADAVDAAVAALENADCYAGDCYFTHDAQWQQFLDESDRITVRYGQAYDSWQAVIATADEQSGQADLPDKPRL